MQGPPPQRLHLFHPAILPALKQHITCPWVRLALSWTCSAGRRHFHDPVMVSVWRALTGRDMNVLKADVLERGGSPILNLLCSVSKVRAARCAIRKDLCQDDPELQYFIDKYIDRLGYFLCPQDFSTYLDFQTYLPGHRQMTMVCQDANCCMRHGEWTFGSWPLFRRELAWTSSYSVWKRCFFFAPDSKPRSSEALMKDIFGARKTQKGLCKKRRK